MLSGFKLNKFADEVCLITLAHCLILYGFSVDNIILPSGCKWLKQELKKPDKFGKYSITSPATRLRFRRRTRRREPCKVLVALHLLPLRGQVEVSPQAG